MKVLKFLLAQKVFDLYLFRKPTRYYTKLDWFLNRWCMNAFSEYENYVVKGVK